MKFTSLTLATFLLLAAAENTKAYEADDICCPPEAKSRGSTFAPGNQDCSKFVQCQNGPPNVMHECPYGLIFNMETLQCDFGGNVDCKGAEPYLCNTKAYEADDICCPPEARVRSSTFAPGNQDCSKFVQCLDGLPKVMRDCGGGLIFNMETLRCDFGGHIVCNGAEPYLCPKESFSEHYDTLPAGLNLFQWAVAEKLWPDCGSPGQNEAFQGRDLNNNNGECDKINICKGNAGHGWNRITVARDALGTPSGRGASGHATYESNYDGHGGPQKRPNYFPSSPSVPNPNGAGKNGSLDDNCNFVEAPVKPENPSSGGDPHFKTWSGKKYDFHGACDLVLLKNPDFAHGLGLDIHIRTQGHSWWSSIDTAVVRVGEHTLEVAGGDKDKVPYWLDGILVEDMETGDASLGDHAIRFHRINGHQSQTRLDLGNGNALSIETFKKFVRVNIKNGDGDEFKGSMGLLGAYPSGEMLGRDNLTVFEDTDKFGQEWQVLPSEPSLFHTLEGSVQPPMKCQMPNKSQARRRLGESLITKEEAALACARVEEENRDACIFDVLATNDKDMAGSY